MKKFVVSTLLVCFLCFACKPTDNLSKGENLFKHGDLEGALECYNDFIDSHSEPTQDLLLALNDRALIQYQLAKKKQDISLAEQAINDWKRYFEIAGPTSSNLVRSYFGCGLLGLQRTQEALEQFDRVCADAPDGLFACRWAQATRDGNGKADICKFKEMRIEQVK